MAKKKPKKSFKKAKKKIVLWRWIIILIPLIVAVMWAIALLIAYDDLPLVYEKASPASVKTLLSLIFSFILTYGAFAFMVSRRNPK